VAPLGSNRDVFLKISVVKLRRTRYGIQPHISCAPRELKMSLLLATVLPCVVFLLARCTNGSFASSEVILFRDIPVWYGFAIDRFGDELILSRTFLYDTQLTIRISSQAAFIEGDT
jgi:hypothetical protein